MGQKMALAPVYFAIVQARFNQILALDSYAPQIQERMRKHGYPDFQKGILTTLNLAPAAANLAPAAATEAVAAHMPVVQETRYVFSNMELTSGFVLNQNALSFQTTEYDVFETFSADFLKGLEAVHEAVDLTYVDRIGLRYLDTVFPRTNEELAEYLAPGVMGLTGKLGAAVIHAFSETLLKTEDAYVRSRASIEKGKVAFPPDLTPMTLRVAERFRNLEGPHARLDTDGWTDQREPLDMSRVRRRLDVIHDAVVDAFHATVTDHALNVWR